MAVVTGLLERTAYFCRSPALRRWPTACGVLFLKTRIQWLNFPVVHSHGKSSALNHILGVKTVQESYALGQHPPPVSFIKEEQDCLLVNQPDQPENPKVLRVAIIGAPNAGKSTLSNELLGRKVFPVSKKVHTTRCQAQGVITDADTQIILLDTPGLTSKTNAKKHNLEKSLHQDPWDSMKTANVVLVLVDIADIWTRHHLHPELLKCLSKYPELPSILVMNKVDLVKKKGVLLDLVEGLTEGFVNGKKLRVKSLIKPIPYSQHKESLQPSAADRVVNISEADCEHRFEPVKDLQDWQEKVSKDNGAPPDHRLDSGEDVYRSPDDSNCDNQADLELAYVTTDKHEKQIGRASDARKGWPHFQEVFMLSAVSGEEVETLKRYLLTLAKPNPWEFHSSVVTTQSPEEICNNIIRSKLLDHLPQEVPYNVTQSIELWEEGPAGELVIQQKLVVQKDSHAKMLIGPGGQIIRKIAQEAGEELMNIFLCDVCLRLAVKVKK